MNYSFLDDVTLYMFGTAFYYNMNSTYVGEGALALPQYNNSNLSGARGRAPLQFNTKNL